MSLARKWMELDIMMLSEISQAQKVKYHLFSLVVKSRTKMMTMMMMMMIRHECNRVCLGENRRKREGKRRGY
jgi:hypothetical protein